VKKKVVSFLKDVEILEEAHSNLKEFATARV
jgi:hypothetical protein